MLFRLSFLKKINKANNNNGIALAVMMILVILLTLLAASILSLQSSQVRIVEHDNSRTRSRYADEATMIRQLERLQNNLSVETYDHDVSGLLVGIDSGASGNFTAVNLTHDFTKIF